MPPSVQQQLLWQSPASGVVGYTLQGHIPWLDGIIIGLAAMLSGALFSKLANRATVKLLITAVGAVFITIGVTMFFVEGGTAGVLHSVQAVLRLFLLQENI